MNAFISSIDNSSTSNPSDQRSDPSVQGAKKSKKQRMHNGVIFLRPAPVIDAVTTPLPRRCVFFCSNCTPPAPLQMIHPVEALAYYVLLYSPPFLFPMPVESFAAYMVVCGLTGVLDHSGITFSLPGLYDTSGVFDLRK